MAQSPDTSDDSSDEWDQWEVVDVQTTTSKSGPSNKHLKEQKKKKEVENLANVITARLAANQAEEKIKIQELNDKIQAQQYQSEQQLEIIRKQLEQISRLQSIHSQQNAQNRLIAAKEKNEQSKLIEQACNQAASLAAQQATQAAQLAASEAARQAANYACEQASAQVNEAAARAAQQAASQAASQAAHVAASQAALQATQQANYQASQRDNAFLSNILTSITGQQQAQAQQNNNNDSNIQQQQQQQQQPSQIQQNLNGNGNNMSSMNPDFNQGPIMKQQQQSQQPIQGQSEEMKSNGNNSNKNNSGGLFSALTTMFVGNPQNDEQKSSQLLGDDCFWDCVACGATNDEAYQFCPKCGARNDLVFNTNLSDLNTLNATAKGIANIKIDDNINEPPLPPIGGTKEEYKGNNKEIDNKINVNLLKFMGAIGQDKKFKPNETRQCGWIFQNESTHKIVMNISIVNVNESDKLVECDFEKSYQLNLAPKEDFYLLFNVKAPIVPGKYSNLYQLITDDSKIIPHTLELMLDVKNVYTSSKEKKIADIVKMGFNDREKIIYALQKNKWNVQVALEALLQE